MSGTGFENFHQDLYTTLRTGNGYLVIDAGQTRTRDAGTPVLPMDMVEADSWRAGLRHVAFWDDVKLESRLYVHSIDHVMDNYSLRDVPPKRMSAPSTSRDYGFSSILEVPEEQHVFRLGMDLHRNDFEAYQELVGTGKTRDMFSGNRRSRLGVFAEWSQTWNAANSDSK